MFQGEVELPYLVLELDYLPILNLAALPQLLVLDLEIRDPLLYEP